MLVSAYQYTRRGVSLRYDGAIRVCSARFQTTAPAVTGFEWWWRWAAPRTFRYFEWDSSTRTLTPVTAADAAGRIVEGTLWVFEPTDLRNASRVDLDMDPGVEVLVEDKGEDFPVCGIAAILLPGDSIEVSALEVATAGNPAAGVIITHPYDSRFTVHSNAPGDLKLTYLKPHADAEGTESEEFV